MIGEYITNRTYHTGPGWRDLIGSSRFKNFLEDPAAFRFPLPIEPTAAMDVGTATHAAILDPPALEDLEVLPDFGFRTKADKQKWFDWLEKNGSDTTGLKTKDEILKAARAIFEDQGKTIATSEQVRAATAMMLSVREDTQAAEALVGGIYERSFKADIRKARPDCINGPLLVDLKTTERFHGFHYQAKDLKYPVSLAWYELVLAEHGIKVEHWAWIAVESSPYRLAVDNIPRHRVRVWVADEELRLRTLDEIAEGLEDLRACMQSGDWPHQEYDIGIIY